jgi:hypothetical protein
MSDFIFWSVKTAWLKTHFQSLRIFFFEDALQYIIPGALLNAASVVTTSQICTHVVLLLLIVENWNVRDCGDLHFDRIYT